MSRDDEQGVSVFAKNKYGSPDYAELLDENLFEDKDYFNQQDANRILGSFRRERKRLVLYLGYPVRVRKHVSKKGWEGFFVEPIFLLPFESDDKYGPPTLTSDLPILNFKALSFLAQGGAGSLMEEVINLSDELGLNNPQEDLPDLEDVFPRLQQLRHEWDWRESIDPENLSSEVPLSEISEEGIYNRAIILYGERSPYTQGLETELKKLSETDESLVTSTALGCWANKSLESPEESGGDEPLIEVLPMNSEQSDAIHRALSQPLTVITGPPGTGKSQVVTNLLINAAWRGQKVLFASKNNKAVDVVETRVNELGSRPVLLRMGSNEYQAKLADYLIQLLSATTTSADQEEYEECFAIHQRLVDRTKRIESQRKKTLAARNKVDELEQQVESLRETLGTDLFVRARNDIELSETESDLENYKQILGHCERDRQPFFVRLLWGLKKKSRFERLEKVEEALNKKVQEIGETLLITPINDSSTSFGSTKLRPSRSTTRSKRLSYRCLEMIFFIKSETPMRNHSPYLFL